MDAVRNSASAHSPAARTLLDSLLTLGQEHLFAAWSPDGEDSAEKAAFWDQLLRVEENYPGGIAAYVNNARSLLASAREGANPFEGFRPEQPDCVDLADFDAEYERLEALGCDSFDKLGVVLVAGGLGERLGYSGIKLELPIELLEETMYLSWYAKHLLAYEQRMSEPKAVPFVIMTSGDTHEKTVACLEANHYFGLRHDQVILLKQELVPALMDNEARIAAKGPYAIQLKPHGHGDVHMLLHRSGVAQKLKDQGIEVLAFIQDTNGQVFHAIPAALGATLDRGFSFNSLAVNRVPGEAVGGLARLVKGEESMTLNVEYNQLDPLLRDTVSPEGDVAGPNGFSMFPGNINVLMVHSEAYVEVLERSQGLIAEFVNPKYADEARTSFKKPTRLETMMQDLPKLFSSAQKVGVTIFERSWCFSPNKNNVIDAAAKHAKHSPPESAATAESDFYKEARRMLTHAGMEVPVEAEQEWLGIPFTPGPRVLLHPSFAVSLAEADSKISGGRLEGTLILEGPDLRLKDVQIDAGCALVVRAVPGANVKISGQLSEGGGTEVQGIPEEELAESSEALRMRGYRILKGAYIEHRFDEPGVYDLVLN